MVTVLPLIPLHVATDRSELVKVTALPEAPPVADTVKDGSPKVLAGSALKVIIWSSVLTLNG